jgi:hypothetical protein
LDFVLLKSEQRRSFDVDGFLVVPKVIGKESIERLIGMGDHLLEPFLKKFEVPNRPEYNHVDFRPGLLKDEASLALVANSPIVPLIVQLLSPNIHLHSTTLIYKRPGDPTAPPFRRGWHRDIRIPKDLGHHQLPRVGIKVCFCLTDFHQPNSGLTLLARKSHLLEGPLEIPKAQVDPHKFEVCDLKLNAGDALLFDNRIFHTASPNKSSRVSKVLIYGYAYRWMKPEVYLERPAPALLAGIDPITHQLLGGYRDVDTPPWALQQWTEFHGIHPEPVPWTVEV